MIGLSDERDSEDFCEQLVSKLEIQWFLWLDAALRTAITDSERQARAGRGAGAKP
jgi:hypothetical protein